MSNVLSILKVIPTSPEANREELLAKAKGELSEGLEIEILKYEEEPLFFGLVAMKLFVKTVDSDEGSEVLQTFEQRLIDVEEIDNCEVELQTIIDY
ncbi:elongation factor 1-beta [Candidatus Heimdallarchaeota archaeon B3_Heim]|nr:MAG: elongation factor 1-beta [Candidatus Heimdallarchaeota archaeon B3_Heim]